jgi:hypothetical protein
MAPHLQVLRIEGVRGFEWPGSMIWRFTTRQRATISSRCKVQTSGAAAWKRGCHRQTVERPQRTQPRADHCRSNRRSRPQDGGAHRYQAPSGKPDPRLEADVDHSGGTRQLRRGRAAVILRFRAATVRRRRQPGSSGRRLSDQLSANPGSRAATRWASTCGRSESAVRCGRVGGCGFGLRDERPVPAWRTASFSCSWLPTRPSTAAHLLRARAALAAQSVDVTRNLHAAIVPRPMVPRN